jgi:hypothetical protein
VPLALAHKKWKAGQSTEALEFVRRFLPDQGAVPSWFEHAVPLFAEKTLLMAECGQHQLVKSLLRPLEEGCKAFGDYETLCRYGRGFKDSGDQKWQADYSVAIAELSHHPAAKMYRHALRIYHLAFIISDHYYPGINAATLALLIGEAESAQSLASRVATICQALHERMPKDEAVWVFASEGEAALLLSSFQPKNKASALHMQAAAFYQSALSELGSFDRQLVQSMYNQLCRLWRVLGRQTVEPVVEVFERSAFCEDLKPGPVGDCEDRISRRASTGRP